MAELRVGRIVDLGTGFRDSNKNLQKLVSVRDEEIRQIRNKAFQEALAVIEAGEEELRKAIAEQIKKLIRVG